MTDKDRVIFATDLIGQALSVLCRINYDNEKQSSNNIRGAAEMLRAAAQSLEDSRV
jgi:hypothetical protein